MQLVVPRQLARQPQEWFFEIVVGLGRDIVVLQVFLAVEGDLLGFDLSVLDFHLVSREDNGDVFADAGEIAVPVGYVLVGDSRGDVEHDNGALSLDVVSITESAELFLSCRVPHIEFDRSTVGVEYQRVNFDSQRGDVLLLELARQVALDKGSLADTSVSHENKLEFWYLCLQEGSKSSERGAQSKCKRVIVGEKQRSGLHSLQRSVMEAKRNSIFGQ